jgi:hypothetical protein
MFSVQSNLKTAQDRDVTKKNLAGFRKAALVAVSQEMIEELRGPALERSISAEPSTLGASRNISRAFNAVFYFHAREAS